MPEMELSSGTIDYEDTGGDGPVVVLVHGLIMDGSLWRHVIADLRESAAASRPRCRWAATATRCAPTPTSRCGGSPNCWASCSSDSSSNR